MSEVLDLEQLDKMDMANPESIETVGRMIDNVYKGSQPYMQRLAYIWEENVRFLQGDQYLFFNDSSRRYEIIPLTKNNDFIPRPVTNYLLPITQTVTSILTKNKPNASVSANSTKDEDRYGSQLAERIQDCKWEQDNEQLLHIKAANIILTCGTVIRKDYWDNSLGPKSAALGGRPVGDNALDMLDPFRLIPDLQSGSWFIEQSVQPLFWIRQQYGIQAPGYTGLAAEVTEDKDLSSVLQFHERLKTTTGRDNGYGTDNEQDHLKGCAVVKEAYIKPTQNHARGFHIVVANNKVLYLGDSPYYDDRYQDSWHPYTFGKWQELYFRWHGLSLLENLVPLQRRLNAIDSLIILTRMTMAAPQKLIPVGCGIPEGYWNGRPGLNIPFNPVGAGGLEPHNVSGIGLPTDVWKERDEIIAAMHAIAGDNEVLQGMRPEGVNTAAGLNMLLEQSFSKFSPFIQQWEKFIEGGQTKKLRLVAARYKEPRPELIANLKSMNQDNLDLEIKDFVGMDLNDNTGVRIEAGSSLPRSKVMEQQNYKELAGMNMFGPIDPTTNPIGNQQFLEEFGVKQLDTELNADVKKARYVNALLTSINRGESDPALYPMLNQWEVNPQSLQIHLKILTDRMKSPEFKDEQQMFNRRFQELMSAMSSLQPQNAGISQPASGPPSPQGPGPVGGALLAPPEGMQPQPAGA